VISCRLTSAPTSSPPVLNFHAEKVLGGARRAARIVARGSLAPWIEDIAQEVVIRVLVEHRRGHKIGRYMYWIFAHKALRSLFGPQADRCRPWERCVPLIEAEETSREPPHDLAPLAFWRLQKVWPTLNDAQRTALCDFLADKPNAIERNACQEALALIDNPMHPPRRGPTIASTYRGIQRDARYRERPWLVRSRGKRLGQFATLAEAIHARDAATVEAG
jgi:hypothetical protein